ncbi:MAG: RecB-like helicase [Campylobacterota bacterium]|nr:RecB-like helicase [Campylobacterota bacterium]
MSFERLLAYSASAGSGKTFALSVRYISLLFMGESTGSILAATFTNKAAAEMRQRVVDSLRRLGDGDNQAFVDALLLQTGLSMGELISRQPEVLAKFLSHKSYIVTLDSFFSSVLRSASLELGLEPDFATKEQGDDELEKHFLEELQAEGLLSSLVKLSMDIEDRRFMKIFDLMQNFYKVDPLLPQQNRVSLSLSKIEEQIEVSRERMIKALSDADAAKRCIGQFETKSVKELFAKALFAKETLGEHSWFKKSINEDIEMIYLQLKEALGVWAKTKESIILYALFHIYDYYRNATITNAKSSGVLSFDDLTYFTYRLLHESISKEFLYFKIDSKFKHILLDEFQDTSTLQFILLKPLIDEIFSGEGQSEFKSFFYVGDTKQSLYRFRGGVEELFDKVSEHYGVKVEPMDINYRSSRLVVSQVNRWFETTMPGYTLQKSQPQAIEGYVEVVESEELIDESVTQLKRLLNRGIHIDSIACLVSTNRDGMALQEACQREGMSTLLQTSSSLKNHPKIAALVAMLTYLFYGEEIDAKPLLERVGKMEKQIEYSWFNPFMEPVAVVDRLVREFGYFDRDVNILKLLEFAANFSDIPTFIDEFESSSISVASQTLSGAKIMTIHGSKGLEFDHVIVLDKLTRKNSDKSALIYHYNDALYIDEILYRMAKRDNFDEHYREIISLRKVSQEKDHKNVLYVALTRAVYGLIVIRKPKDSIFDDIGMAPMVLGSLPLIDESKEQSGESWRESRAVEISHYGTQEIPKRPDDEDMKDFDAILLGTALHYLLEMMGSFDMFGLDEGMDSLLNRYGQLLHRDRIEDIYQRVKSLIEDHSFQDLLEGATIHKEQSLSYDGKLKQIDLLLEYDDSYLVIDYKSSQKYHQEHLFQVAAYQKAIKSITGMRAEGMIIYLLKDKILLDSLK